MGGACGSEGDRSPLAQGDYLGDVDIFVVETAESGTLCATASIAVPDDGTERGWDLILYELDACSVPVSLVAGADDLPLGLGRAGPVVEWSHNVPALSRYAVLLAGFLPNDLDAPFPYELGITMVPAHPDGGPALCPFLPGELGP